MNKIPDNLHTIYLMAICGTGMGSLAGLLKQKGYTVTGADNNVYPPMSTELEKQDIKILSPYSSENIKTANPDLVIVGNAISKNNVEAEYLLASGIPYISMAEALNHFFLNDKEVIVVSGTHGKTTTTSIMAHLLTELGADPSFMIGGVSRNFSKNFRIGNGKYFVIEGDEYDTAFFDKGPKFLHYNPRHVIMTSLEFDHADIYRDLAHITESFVKLAKIIPANGSLHVNDGYVSLQSVVSHASCLRRSYGSRNAEFRIVNFQPTSTGSQFDIELNSKTLANVSSPLSGLYNAENVAACFSVLEHLGFDLHQAALALTKFQGVKRRQEILFQNENHVVIDDFAHHPTAIHETIGAIKQQFPKHHLVAVFEPRSNTSRRAIFQNQFAQCFLQADQVILAPVNNPEKIVGDKILDVALLVKTLNDSHLPSYQAHDTQDIIQKILHIDKKPLLALIMSNGGFDGLNQKLIQALPK